MARNKIRSKQKTKMTVRMRIILATSAVTLLAAMLVIYFNFSDVQESKAFSPGDYRTISSGDWEDVSVWEVFDGSGWIQAEIPPGETVKKIQLTNNQQITLTEEIVVNSIVIDEGSTLIIESNTVRISKFNNVGGVVCNGSLFMGSTILEGNGDFVAGSTAKLFIGSDAGIDRKGASGNIQLSGKKEFHRDATYIFNGSIRQRTGNGLPLILSKLVLDNNSGVDLDQNLQVLHKIDLVKGVLHTGIYSLTLGISVSSTCEVITEIGALNGNVKIWYESSDQPSLRYPVADGSQYCNLEFIPENNRFQKGLLELKYQEGIPDDSRKSPFEARQVVVAITGEGYFSAMLSNGAGEAWMQLIKIADENNRTKKVTWKFIEKGDPAVESTGNKTISNILYGPGYFRNQLVVRFFSEQKSSITIQMISQKGQIMQLSAMETQPGYNQFVFRPEKVLMDGPYMVHIGNSTEIHTFRAVCQAEKNTVKGS